MEERIEELTELIKDLSAEKDAAAAGYKVQLRAYKGELETLVAKKYAADEVSGWSDEKKAVVAAELTQMGGE